MFALEVSKANCNMKVFNLAFSYHKMVRNFMAFSPPLSWPLGFLVGFPTVWSQRVKVSARHLGWDLHGISMWISLGKW